MAKPPMQLKPLSTLDPMHNVAKPPMQLKPLCIMCFWMPYHPSYTSARVVSLCTDPCASPAPFITLVHYNL